MVWSGLTLFAPFAAWARSVGELVIPDVFVRYFAAAADAAGREEESFASLSTVGELRDVLREKYGEPMTRVLLNGSFLVDGIVSSNDASSLGLKVDVLPPFSGG